MIGRNFWLFAAVTVKISKFYADTGIRGFGAIFGLRKIPVRGFGVSGSQPEIEVFSQKCS